MAYENAEFEIHLHGDVPLREDVDYDKLQEALKPIWAYSGAKSLTKGAGSSYPEEPGILHDTKTHTLHLCWTIEGNEDFRQALDEMCMRLNELCRAGAALELSFYDMAFEEDDEDSPGNDEDDSRDDFYVLFVGPTPGDILQVQRDLLVQDMVHMMERHFDATELGGVVGEIDVLFEKRFTAMAGAMDIQKIMRGPSNGPSGSGPSHGNGRKPRHLH